MEALLPSPGSSASRHTTALARAATKVRVTSGRLNPASSIAILLRRAMLRRFIATSMSPPMSRTRLRALRPRVLRMPFPFSRIPRQHRFAFNLPSRFRASICSISSAAPSSRKSWMAPARSTSAALRRGDMRWSSTPPAG